MGLVRTFLSGFSYIKASIFKKKEDSLENFYINRFGEKLYSMFFENYTEKLWGRHPKQISADLGSQRVKGLSITAIISDIFTKVFHIKRRKIEISLIEEFYYPKYGPGHFWETVAANIEKMGGKLIMNTPVTDIEFKGDKIVSVSSNDIKYKGDIIISSMPLKDLVNGLYGDKQVNKNIRRIANGLPYRDFITIGCLVPKLNLINKTKIKTLGNVVPDCWIYVQDETVKLLRLQIFNNWSPYLLKNPQNEVWIGAEYTCQEGDNLWNMSDAEFSDFALNELEKINIIDKNSVILYHVERVKKAYPSYFDTYYEIDKLIQYLNKFTNLYCIGRNGQHRYNNMDHSMLTAFETVDNILSGKKDKDNIWKVNTEKEFHEEKYK